MTPMSGDLPEHVAAVLDATKRFASTQPHIVAVALVGSWARRAGRPDSDVDLVILSSEPSRLLAADDWHERIHPEAELVRMDDYGAIQERRLRFRVASRLR